MSTLRFLCRTDKPDRYGKCQIHLIYQIGDDIKKLNTHCKLHPGYWNQKDQAAEYIKPSLFKKKLRDISSNIIALLLLDESEVNDINNDLAGIRSKIADIETKFKLDKKPYNAESVLDCFKKESSPITRKADEKNLLTAAINAYTDDHRLKLTPGTRTIYHTLKKDIEAYELKTRCQIGLMDLSHAFYTRFQNYLIETGRLNNNTIAKKISYLKTAVLYADRNGFPITHGHKGFKVEREKIKVIALTQEEFDRLAGYDFKADQRLARVRDVFCFSCATGLRMSDMAQLKWEHIKDDQIELVTEKTSEHIEVPLNQVSAAILERYKGLQRPLPIISNQKLNEYIKEACKLAEINDPIEIVEFKGYKRAAAVHPKWQLIHIHTGRKTFCTLSLEKGMTAEQVMAITGHKSYKVFKRYFEVTSKVKKVAMVTGWGAPRKLKIV